MGANVGSGQSAHGLSGAQILARLLALGAGALAFPDNVFSIVGSSDATKIAAFEVDGFTTGTTRTFTLPNASITVAGINLAQTFSATQTFAGIDATTIGATTRGTGLFTTLGANGAVTLTSTLAVTGAATFAAAGATANPVVIIGSTGAGSTETNQALRVGNISATGKYLAMGYDSTNDYAYIAGIHAATGWKTVAINPYANAICSINAGGGATTVGGTLAVTGVATFTTDIMSSGGNVGSAAYFKHSSADTSSVELTGSNATSGTFAGITVYGKSHASQANRIFYDSARHGFRSASGGTDYLVIDGTTVTMSLPAVVSVGAANATLDLITSTNGNQRGIKYTDSAGSKYNWYVGAQITTSDAWEIIPSTAAGGSTFSTAALRIAAATSAVTITGALSVGSTLTLTGTLQATGSGSTFTNGASQTIVNVGNSTAGYASIRMLNGSTHYGWSLSTQDNISEAFEVTPSTAVGGTTFSGPALIVYQTGSIVLGTRAALATNATDGFTYLPTCAGTPTGAPTAVTGKVAWVYDTTNNIIYIYNGAWKKTAALT